MITLGIILIFVFSMQFGENLAIPMISKFSIEIDLYLNKDIHLHHLNDILHLIMSDL